MRYHRPSDGVARDAVPTIYEHVRCDYAVENDGTAILVAVAESGFMLDSPPLCSVCGKIPLLTYILLLRPGGIFERYCVHDVPAKYRREADIMILALMEQ